MYQDEDNDGRYPDESPVEVRYPRSKQEAQGDRAQWSWPTWDDCRAVRPGRMVHLRRGPQAGRAPRRPARTARRGQP